MQTQKMSLANIKGKLSRVEMKNIMAGSLTTCSGSCDVTVNGTTTKGSCKTTDKGLCYCSSGMGQC